MEYVTIKKAAEMLGVSRPTVYKLILDGKLKSKRIADRPAIATIEIEKHVNSKRVKTA